VRATLGAGGGGVHGQIRARGDRDHVRGFRREDPRPGRARRRVAGGGCFLLGERVLCFHYNQRNESNPSTRETKAARLIDELRLNIKPSEKQSADAILDTSLTRQAYILVVKVSSCEVYDGPLDPGGDGLRQLAQRGGGRRAGGRGRVRDLREQEVRRARERDGRQDGPQRVPEDRGGALHVELI
jgi:hypothetical protein